MKLLFLLCVFYFIQFLKSESIIIDKLTKGFSQIDKDIKCEAHKFGNIIHNHHHDHDPCHKAEDEGYYNEIEHNTIDESSQQHLTTEQVDTKDIDQWSSTTKSPNDVVTVPGGRSIVSAKSNCPPGQRADSRGKCRIQF